MRTKRVFAFLSLIVLSSVFAIAPGTAGASSAAQNAYSEAVPLNEVREAATGSSSVLPFTGLDLVIILLLGVALLGIGLLIKRANASTSA